jgi:transcription elongation GreA/GreB family factor
VTDGERVVDVGCWVAIRDGETREDWRIVDPSEADATRRLISAQTPLARALLGHRAGEHVHVRGPGERYGVTIIEVAVRPPARRLAST